MLDLSLEEQSAREGTHIVQTSKIGKMQLLILLDWFEREKGENALPFGVFVGDDVLHPAVRRTAVVLYRKSACERGPLAGTNQEPSELGVIPLAMDMKGDKTAHVSYVECVHHVVVPSQIKEIGSAIFVV